VVVSLLYRRMSRLPGLLMILACMAVVQFAKGQGSSGSVHPNNAVSNCQGAASGSPFIPVDSWIYPVVWRLHSLGFIDNIFLGIRPWTRASLSHMLEETDANLDDAEPGPVTDEARSLYEALKSELNREGEVTCAGNAAEFHLDSAYTTALGISGTPLHDSYHLGSTMVNDYGRPYENGFNNYSGASGYAVSGPFTLYLRGEFQGAPSAAGYSPSLYQSLAAVDLTVNPVTNLAYGDQVTIPAGPIGTTTQGRFLEAYLSTQLLNNVISFGKEDEWLGPAKGASFAYSNNAENLYAFHINRIEPLDIPLLSQVTGPFRYEFLVGELRGHTLMPNPLYTPGSTTQANVISPGNPWLHVEKISFKPTPNIEFGFERTALFGGEGHSPVTLRTFLKSFFSWSAPAPAIKESRDDPGARYGAFDFSYRLPYLRNWVTLYADGEVHDDVSPIDAPRRASWRPGVYLARVPKFAKLDLRAEAVTTDPPVSTSNGGIFMYWEVIERQGYTNQGQLFGDWIGREDKGGQAWMTYHLSGNEWIQLTARTQKAAKDFIPGGTTLNDIGIDLEKRIHHDIAIGGSFTSERWKAPVYLPGEQSVTTTRVQVTWYPRGKSKSDLVP
jgi:hypothetical protein